MHPLDHLAAATSLPIGDDEFEAGSLRGQPLEMTDAVSVPLQVPATAEYILEGHVRKGVREPEGPFGDFLDFYIPTMDNHSFVLSAITHRDEPIWQTMYAGSPEGVALLGVSREAAILEAAEATGAQVHAVCIGPTIFTAAIAISPATNTGLDPSRGCSLMVAMRDGNWSVTEPSEPTRSSPQDLCRRPRPHVCAPIT